jgi:hypothetical protein
MGFKEAGEVTEWSVDGGGVFWIGVDAALRWSSKRVGTKSTDCPTNVRARARYASDAYVKVAGAVHAFISGFSYCGVTRYISKT